MLTILASAFLGAGLPSLPPHASTLTANVNDPRSHGVLGDAFLSLDEAIQLANGTLLASQLSAQEQAQLTGTGMMVDGIVIDAMVTPTITLERVLTPVTGMNMGMGMLTISGMNMGGMMARPMLDGGGNGYILSLQTAMVQVMGLQFHGGQVGLDVQVHAGGMTQGQMAMVMDCGFDGSATAGIKLHGTGTDNSTMMLSQAQFANLPTGILMDDQTNLGLTMAEMEFLQMDGVQIGIDIVENGRLNLGMCMVFRSTMVNGQTFLRMSRGVGSTQQFMVMLTYCDLHTTGDCVDIQGVANALTMVHHHHSNFVAATGSKAFYAHPRTAQFDLHGSENTFEGDVSIAANLFTQRVWHQNNQYRNGTLTFDTDGSLPNLLWNRYENCSLVVPATALTALHLHASELLNTSVNSQSGAAAIVLDGCYRSGGSLTGLASETNAAPARFLGTTTVLPPDPQIGATLTLATDLPFGIGAFWDVGVSYARPTTTIEPFRFYGDPLTAVVLPGMVVFQSQTRVPIPNAMALVGLEFYVQAIDVPLLGQSWAPIYHLPIGGLVRPRL